MIALRSLLAGVTAAACLATGCSSSANAPAGSPAESSPGSLPPSTHPPTSISAVPGADTSDQFLGGDLTFTLPDAWSITEDSTGEFGVTADGDWRVLVWTDLYPTAFKRGLDPIDAFGTQVSAAQITAWLHDNPNLKVTDAGSIKIGRSGIPMSAVDVSVATDAVNDDPHCPTRACSNFLGFPVWGEPYGLAGRSATRFMFADVTVSDTPRLLVVAVEAPTRAELSPRFAAALAYLDSLALPLS